MKEWLKKYWFSIFMLIMGLYFLYNSVRFGILPRDGWGITGTFAGLLMLVAALDAPLKANGKERTMHIITAISGGVAFLSWVIIMFLFGDSIELIDTLLVLVGSGLLLVVSIVRLRGTSKDLSKVEN